MKRAQDSLWDSSFKITAWFPTLFSILCMWGVVLLDPTIGAAIVAGAVSLIITAFTSTKSLITESKRGKELSAKIDKTEDIASKTENQVENVAACTDTIKTDVKVVKEQTGYIKEISDLLHEFKGIKASQASDINPASVLASMAHTYEENQALKAENEKYRKRVRELTQKNQQLERELGKFRSREREIEF